MAPLPLLPSPAWALLAALLLASAAADAPSVADQAKSQQPPPPPCHLAGMWVNELGSRMVLSAANEAGVFSGSYLTAVSDANGAITESPLQGAQHHPARAAQPTFAFTVHWRFSDSTTAFVGQCFVDEQGEETLETLWLLRKKVASRAEDWKATLVGKNVFMRVK
uniref:avidin-related protein 4/5-like n=1 Tax=Euleptes europaea TaxID=460621 RepID=UPI0025406AAC|nr:avidin-related protein 4/5-like [Euleptes europaea]XP_056704191.1 avidin-related protein 4/5-like [Euleptes europaea]XP_056704192.1 avidin-related protein 4/5-like [Euleptes europaea]